MGRRNYRGRNYIRASTFALHWCTQITSLSTKYTHHSVPTHFFQLRTAKYERKRRLNFKNSARLPAGIENSKVRKPNRYLCLPKTGERVRYLYTRTKTNSRARKYTRHAENSDCSNENPNLHCKLGVRFKCGYFPNAATSLRVLRLDYRFSPFAVYLCALSALYRTSHNGEGCAGSQVWKKINRLNALE